MKNSVLRLFATSLLVGTVASLTATAAESSLLSDSSAPPPYRPFTVGVGAGTDGLIGVSGGWRFADHLGLRAGVGYTEVSSSDVGIGGTRYDVRVRLLDEPLNLDYYPWQQRSFRVSLGLMFNQNELTGTATHTGITIIDGQPFPTDEVGSLHLKIRQQPVNPYLGLGGNLFYFDHAHHWALSGELGVAYTGDARVSLTRSGGSGTPGPIDAAVSRAQSRAQRYADQFKFWPVAKLSVTYSF